MKRLLLSCALIGVSFACNAMDPMAAGKAKYSHILNLEARHKLTVKAVNKNLLDENFLLDNEYVRSNSGEFIEHALEIRHSHLTEEHLSEMIQRYSANPTKSLRDYLHNLLGLIRIVEIAGYLTLGSKHIDQLDIEGLDEPKDRLEELLGLKENNIGFLSSVSSVVSLRNGAIGLAVLAGIVGISYWNSSKKAPQDN